MNWLIAILFLMSQTFSNIVLANETCENKIVKYGSKGNYALKAQELLKKYGYYCGNITGDFDMISVNATLNYQRAQCIPDTGMIDSETWDRLLRDPQVPVQTALPKNIKNKGVFLVASKSQRKLFYIKDGTVKKVIDARFAGFIIGLSGYPQIRRTKNGTYKVYCKHKNDFSKTWKQPMPYCIRIDPYIYIHFSNDFAKIGYDGASPGCINLRSIKDAKWLYENTKIGSTVIIY